jgi:hypothetical protein
MRAIDRLGLDRRVPPRIENKNIVGRSQATENLLAGSLLGNSEPMVA